MSSTTEFVTELWRAANEVEKLTMFERRRLLERAAYTIRDMRAAINFSGRPKKSGDVVERFEAMARDVALVPAEEIAQALSEAAEMIRTLKILLDAKDEVSRDGNPD